MKARWEVGGAFAELDVAVVGDAIRVRGPEGERTFRVEQAPDGSRWLVEGARRHRIDGEGDEVVVEGRPRRVRQAPQGAAAPPPVVTPPMPAVVTRVLVALGQAVSTGEALVTVTAMKMELTLRSPRDGVVRAIRAAPGDKVGPGDVLVEVEP